MTGFAIVLEALRERGLVSTEENGRVSARCPSHDDQRASLSLAEGDDGKALLYCFASCETPTVVEALGLSMADLFTAAPDGTPIVQAYVYTDEDGEPLIRVLRKHPKGFTQERWDADDQMWKPRILGTRRVPYRLPQLLAASRVWLVEGEKDVETLEALGEPATTLLGGAGKWRDEYEAYFQGKDVSIVADADKAGLDGALKVKNALRGVARVVRVFLPAAGKDVTDHLNAGLTLPMLVPHAATSEAIFQPFDWQTYEVERSEWLFEPYVPKGSRVMVYGAAGSLKSLWAMWLAARLAKEGHRVAYFSLEMRPSETARRLKKLDPPLDRFKWYSKFSFANPAHLDAACELLRDFSLIVVDSWSAVKQEGRESNEDVALLDQRVFQPLIEETGATLLILDNTGHPTFTDNGVQRPDWARGASAKGDKMDVNLFFERPAAGDNHRVTISVKKMRLDRRIPKPVTVWTDPDDIEFIVTDPKGYDLGPLWTYYSESRAEGRGGQAPPVEHAEPPTLRARLAAARAKSVLGEQALSGGDAV